ncbi:MAG: hypothetical protein K2X27_01930 [Candidatus Obscuribacterales bacterium]|nr:hypothetical protein [Candidatus Obscuribacterales bacterium]
MWKNLLLAALLIASLTPLTAAAYDLTMLKGTYVQFSDIGVPYVKKLILAQGEHGKVKVSAVLSHMPNEQSVTAEAEAYIQRDAKLMQDKRTGDRLLVTFTTPKFSNFMEIDTGRRAAGQEPDWATVNVRSFIKHADGHNEYFDEVLDRTE